MAERLRMEFIDTNHGGIVDTESLLDVKGYFTENFNPLRPENYVFCTELNLD